MEWASVFNLTTIWYAFLTTVVLTAVSWAAGQHRQHSASGSGTHQSAGTGTGQDGSSPPQSTQQQDTEGQNAEGADDADAAHGVDVRLKVLKIAGTSGEIARILRCRDHYAVLEVPRDAPGPDVKRAFRTKQLATHPDKHHGAPGALEASQRVNAANEALSDEVRRRQYLAQLEDEEQHGPRSQRKAGAASNFTEQAAMFDAFVRENMAPPPPGALYPTIDPAAYDSWGTAPDHSFRMACQCGYDHLATKVCGRPSSAARLCTCQDCGRYKGKRLPAREDDVWFESSSSFLRALNPERFIRAYRCVGLCVYDITAWANCNGMLADAHGTPAPTNTHKVPFRLSGTSNSKTSRAKAERREKTGSSSYGFNQFKGKGVDSHKTTNNKKKRK